MIKVIYLFLGIITCSIGQEIGSSAKLINPNLYYAEVIQETIYELERKEWCNLRMADITQDVNEITHTNILVSGQVKYTNGFLVSVQKIHITRMGTPSMFSRLDENNVTTISAYLSGRLHFMDLAVGYDVAVNLTNENHVRRYTGIFTHSSIEVTFGILRNMHTKAITVDSLINSVAAGSGVRMVFMPSDAVSEVVSLTFIPSRNSVSITAWMREIIQPMIVDVATNKVKFPEICLNC